MFVTKIIESENYYRNFRIITLLSLLPGLSGLIVAVGMGGHWAWIIFFLLLFLLAGFYIKRISRALLSLSEKRVLEMDSDTIRIYSKIKTGTETIEISSLDRISISGNLSLANESLADLWRTLSGRHHRNQIIIEKEGEMRQLEFLLDSHYMREELKRLQLVWAERGIKLQLKN